MRRVLWLSSLLYAFGLGWYLANDWPHLQSHAEYVLKPVRRFLEAPQLADARLAEIQSLRASRVAIEDQLNARLRERDMAIEEVRKAAARHAALCQAIQSLDLTGAALPALVQE